MILNYYQPSDAPGEGVLVLDGEIFRTTGRLDVVGSRVFASGFRATTAEHGDVRLSVSCERTGEEAIAVDLVVFGQGGIVLRTHRVEDVRLVRVAAGDVEAGGRQDQRLE